MALDKKILSVDADDDDGVDIKSFTIFSEENTKRNKNVVANQIIEIGEDLLAEVEEKNRRKEREKKKYVRYILRHSKTHIKSQLISYSLEDVKDIYEFINKSKGYVVAMMLICSIIGGTIAAIGPVLLAHYWK